MSVMPLPPGIRASYKTAQPSVMPKRKSKKLLNSLVPLLMGMRGKPVIVELKNSTTIEGLVVHVDYYMKYVAIAPFV